MARLDSGTVMLNRQWHVLEELVGLALRDIKRELDGGAAGQAGRPQQLLLHQRCGQAAGSRAARAQQVHPASAAERHCHHHLRPPALRARLAVRPRAADRRTRCVRPSPAPAAAAAAGAAAVSTAAGLRAPASSRRTGSRRPGWRRPPSAAPPPAAPAVRPSPTAHRRVPALRAALALRPQAHAPPVVAGGRRAASTRARPT